MRRPVAEIEQTDTEFESFFRREYVKLARACLLLTRDPAEAEELAQDALTRVYARWDQVRSMESPEGYLYRTALNLHRKRLRQLATRARHALDRTRLADSLEAADERLDVLRAVSALPRSQREALVLVEWLDLDVNEAAQILELSPSSVRVRLHRARRTLRERFGGPDE
jgi:RNA polymerase sigma factor (sigma-70 family)